jgi:hypothetical protein
MILQRPRCKCAGILGSDPMSGTDEVCVTYTQGPICGLGDAGIEASYPLWDSILAAESFPPGAGASGANYVLRIRKGVSHASEVLHAEDQLTEALQMLAAAWPFSGGSYLPIERRDVVCSPNFESNANELVRKLASSDPTEIAFKPRVHLGWSATYSKAPLRVAADIARLMHCDFQTRKLLLDYHQRSLIERNHPAARDGASWFISLYKIRDFLGKIYDNDKAAQCALGISTKQWTYFGKVLNNHDLRHAEIKGIAPPIPLEVQDKLYRMALGWVASYLRAKGLPAIG